MHVGNRRVVQETPLYAACDPDASNHGHWPASSSQNLLFSSFRPNGLMYIWYIGVMRCTGDIMWFQNQGVEIL